MASQPLSIVDIYRAVEHAARSTESQLDDHAIYSLDQAIKQKTLKIFVDPRVKALVTLTRRRDDTITLHLGNQRANSLSEPRSDGIISSHWARQPLESQRLRLKELILKRLVKSHGQRTIDQSFLTNGYHILTGIILTDIDDRTEKILKNIYNHIQNGSGREETILSHATSKINKQIRTRIIRKDLVQIAVQLVVQPPPQEPSSPPTSTTMSFSTKTPWTTCWPICPTWPSSIGTASPGQLAVQYHQVKTAQWNWGDPWRHRVHIINQFLSQEITTEDRYYRQEYPLHSMLDAFIYHVEHKLPWPMTEWEAYSRRSHRWRQQIKEKNQGPKKDYPGFP